MIRRLGKSLLIGSLISIVAIWIASYWNILYALSGNRHTLFLSRGCVSWTQQSVLDEFAFEVYESIGFKQTKLVVLGFNDLSTDWMPLLFRQKLADGQIRLRLPLWPLALFLFIAVLWSFVLRNSWIQWRFPNCCKNCRYSLVGNSSGVCPECGTKTDSETQVKDD